MKKLTPAIALFLASPLLATEYGGSNFYQSQQASLEKSSSPKVVAQADSMAELRQQLAINDEMEINQLLSQSPTAAGSNSKIIQRKVVDRCYQSWQAVACSTKSVYQLLE